MYLKVKHPTMKRAVYLEQAKFIEKGKFKFVSGYVIDKYGEPKIYKGGSIMHLFQIGNGVKVVEQEMDKHYGELKDKGSRIED